MYTVHNLSHKCRSYIWQIDFCTDMSYTVSARSAACISETRPYHFQRKAVLTQNCNVFLGSKRRKETFISSLFWTSAALNDEIAALLSSHLEFIFNAFSLTLAVHSHLLFWWVRFCHRRLTTAALIRDPVVCSIKTWVNSTCINFVS
jgi:hypothetical protein